MAYTINLTDGTIFATIADGTINTSSSMILVGKNYAGYGEFLDENFIHLLENGANTTAPGAPLTGQLWWDKSTNTMKVYTGTTFKTISAATAASSAPTNNVVGDLWFDTTNQQLKVWNGSSFVLIGPASTSGQGTSGAIVATVQDNTTVNHVVVQLWVQDTIVGIISKDATFTPGGAGLPGTWGTTAISPGINLNPAVSNNLFRGTATDSNLFGGLATTAFIRANTAATTSGTLGILNDSGLTVGADGDARLLITGNDVFLRNQTNNGNLLLQVNVGGVNTTGLTVFGANGTVSGTQINANYADVAERFKSDAPLEPGMVVELGGSAEITLAKGELSESVIGVVSTRAAYLMNSNAGSDETHPAIAMTGRVPVKVRGPVQRGDRLVSAGEGLARAARPGEATAFNVIGRSLDEKTDSDVGTVEAIVRINN
jgi:hypothetical protein